MQLGNTKMQLVYQEYFKMRNMFLIKISNNENSHAGGPSAGHNS